MALSDLEMLEKQLVTSSTCAQMLLAWQEGGHAYTLSSKHALAGFTKQLAWLCKAGIQVFGIAPKPSKQAWPQPTLCQVVWLDKVCSQVRRRSSAGLSCERKQQNSALFISERGICHVRTNPDDWWWLEFEIERQQARVEILLRNKIVFLTERGSNLG